jgi:hypothetical protein
VYLQQARQHERPRPLQDLEQAALFPQVEIDEQFVYEHQHLLLGINYAMLKSAREDRALVDVDLIAALASIAKTYATLVNSGLHYEAPTAGIGRHAVVSQIQSMVKEYREVEQEHSGHSHLKDSDLLRAVVCLVRIAHTRTSGRPKSRAFLDFLAAQFPEKEARIATADDVGSRILTP